MLSLNNLRSTALILAMIFIGNGSYIQIKAWLAQHLIEYSFAQSKQLNELTKPWPWADTHAIAKLHIGDTTNFILHDANMRNLAFGPAHFVGSPLPGDKGNSVILGHRDTHFAHLQNVEVGQSIIVSTHISDIKYRVEELMIVDQTDVGVIENMSQTALTLITCYPFNSISPDPDKRFVVRAVKES